MDVPIFDHVSIIIKLQELLKSFLWQKRVETSTRFCHSTLAEIGSSCLSEICSSGKHWVFHFMAPFLSFAQKLFHMIHLHRCFYESNSNTITADPKIQRWLGCGGKQPSIKCFYPALQNLITSLKASCCSNHTECNGHVWRLLCICSMGCLTLVKTI